MRITAGTSTAQSRHTKSVTRTYKETSVVKNRPFSDLAANLFMNAGAHPGPGSGNVSVSSHTITEGASLTETFSSGTPQSRSAVRPAAHAGMEISSVPSDSSAGRKSPVKAADVPVSAGIPAEDTPAVSIASVPAGLTEEDFSALSVRQQFLVLAALLRRLILDQFGGSTNTSPLDLLNGRSGGQFVYEERTTAVSCAYTESEETSVTIGGEVQTSDGRSIGFNVDLTMSRRFTEKYMAEKSEAGFRLADPLIIHMDAPEGAVLDQSFSFDLDSDGRRETVAAPGQGSGFLAMDRNGDGRITNGAELFGASTGDGFGELMELDSDGDGWIDEDDNVWQNLLVMTVNPDGSTTQMTLSEADVGAICLDAVRSEFSVKDQDNSLKGIIRSTGVYLHENGTAGIVQQTDLASQRAFLA